MAKKALLVAVLAAFLAGCGPTPEPTRGPALGDTQTRSSDGMVMVYIPSAQFEMNSSDAQVDEAWRACKEVYGVCKREWFEHEQPAHTVVLDAFWINRTEVTNAQFAAFLNEQGNQIEGEVTWLELESKDSLIEQVGSEFRPKSGYADHPVIKVSWYGAAAYCAWVGGRLPTEAEWEYAARGPDGPMYPWGDTFDGNRLNYCDANCEFEAWKDSAYNDGYARLAPVGSYPNGASWCGALDMAGNVWEWVAGQCDGEYDTCSPSENPQGSDSGEFRPLRGGSWYCDLRLVRSDYRFRVEPRSRFNDLGFRCAVSARAISQAEMLPFTDGG